MDLIMRWQTFHCAIYQWNFLWWQRPLFRLFLANELNYSPRLCCKRRTLEDVSTFCSSATCLCLPRISGQSDHSHFIQTRSRRSLNASLGGKAKASDHHPLLLILLCNNMVMSRKVCNYTKTICHDRLLYHLFNCLVEKFRSSASTSFSPLRSIALDKQQTRDHTLIERRKVIDGISALKYDLLIINHWAPPRPGQKQPMDDHLVAIWKRQKIDSQFCSFSDHVPWIMDRPDDEVTLMVVLLLMASSDDGRNISWSLLSASSSRLITCRDQLNWQTTA